MDAKRQNFSWPLLGSNFSFVFGDGLYRFALNWFLVASYGDAKVVGWLTSFGFVVYLLNDLYVGALLDRFNRKILLLGADAFGALGLVSLAWFVNPDKPQIWLLAILTFILNVDISFAYPAGRAIIPDVIKANRLAQFNAWASVAFSTGATVAPLVGGLLLQLKWVDLRTFLIGYGIMLMLTVLMNMFIKYQPEPNNQVHENIFTSMVEGYKYVVKRPRLFESMLITMWGNVFFESFLVAIPFLVQKVYGGTAAQYALMLTWSAVAGILAGIFLTRFPQFNNVRTLYWDFIVAGVLFIAATFVPVLWVLFVVEIAFGYARETFGVKIMTIRQTASEPEFIGRVFGISFMVTDLFVPFTTVIMGYVVGPLGRWILFILGAALIIGLIIIHQITKLRLAKFGEM